MGSDRTFELETLRQPRRLHLRRGVRAARGDGGQAGRAAQQAAVPGHPRPVRQADRHQQRRDPGLRAAHPAAAAPTGSRRRAQNGAAAASSSSASAAHVARPGVYEVADGHARPARSSTTSPAACRNGRRAEGLGPVGAVVGLPAGLDDRLAARLRTRWPRPARCSARARCVVMAEGTCMLDMALNAVRFFRNESCGKCVPCRVGSAEDGRAARPGSTRGQAGPGDMDTHRRPRPGAAAHLDLRPGPGRAEADALGRSSTSARRWTTHLLRQRCPAGVCSGSGGGLRSGLDGDHHEAALMAPATSRRPSTGSRSSVPAGTTIFDAARAARASPSRPSATRSTQTPVGVCRVCVVEVKNARVLPAACVRPVEAGHGGHDRAPRRAASAPDAGSSCCWPTTPSPAPGRRRRGDCELENLAAGCRPGAGRASRGRPSPRGRDDSPPIIAVDHTACILCDRCIRGCTRGAGTTSSSAAPARATRRGSPSTPTSPWGSRPACRCGECMVSCPTGALTLKTEAASSPASTRRPAGRRDADVGRRSGTCRSCEGCRATFLDLNRGAGGRRHVPAGRGHLPGGRVRLHRVLRPEGQGRGLHPDPDGPLRRATPGLHGRLAGLRSTR